MGELTENLTSLEPGSLFAGYRIEGLLARGGMGVVYKATEVDLDRTVALKLIAPEHTQNEDAVARFKSEARLAASLEHPNIVPIHRGGEFEGVLYLAMRLVPGINLRELINQGPLAMDQVQRVITQVAAALDAAHERGLVHRDVKPANILIGGEGDHEHVYLTDFGLTKRLGSAGSLTQTGTWVGTPDYVAPEQIQAGNIDGRTDVYSLGCVLYEMVTGSVAFPRDNDVAKLWAHVSDSPPPPSMKRPDLVPAFDEIVARATAKDPDRRFAKPSELAAAVQRAIGAQGSKLTGPEPGETRPVPTGRFRRDYEPELTAPSASRDEVFIAEPTQAPGQPARDETRAAVPPPPVSPPPPPEPPSGGQPASRQEDGGPARTGGFSRYRWPLAAGLALAFGIVGVVVLSSGSDEKASTKKAFGNRVPATLGPVPTNRVTGDGSATFEIKGNVARVTLKTNGLLDNAPHALHVHAGGKVQCPPASAAGLHNGHRVISTKDGGPYYGPPRATLTTSGNTSSASKLAFNRYPASGNIAYRRTIRFKPAVIRFIRANRAFIVVHGIDYNRNGLYDGVLDRSEDDPAVQGETTAPALCGPLISSSPTVRSQLPGAPMTLTASLSVRGVRSQAATPAWHCVL